MGTVKIKGKQYVPTVIQIVKRDDLNRPVKLIVKYGNDVIDLKEEDNDFMVAFVSEAILKVPAKKDSLTETRRNGGEESR